MVPPVPGFITLYGTSVMRDWLLRCGPAKDQPWSWKHQILTVSHVSSQTPLLVIKIFSIYIEFFLWLFNKLVGFKNVLKIASDPSLSWMMAVEISGYILGNICQKPNIWTALSMASEKLQLHSGRTAWCVTLKFSSSGSWEEDTFNNNRASRNC